MAKTNVIARGPKGLNLEGMTMMVTPGTFRPEFADLEKLPFRATFGNGCYPNSLGTKVFGMFSNGYETYIRRENVSKVIQPIPVLDRMVALKEAAGEEWDAWLKAQGRNEYSLGEHDEWTRAFWYALLEAEGIMVDGCIDQKWSAA